MAIFACGLILFLFFRNIRTLKTAQQLLTVSLLIIFIIGLIAITTFLESKGWEYAVAGADMEQHLEAAKAISEGKKWADLSRIGSRFENVGINTIGYFLYAGFLAIMIYVPGILPEGFNIYVTYIFQVVLMLDALVRLSKAYGAILGKSEISKALLLLGLFPAYLITAAQLLRDTYFIWFIAAVLEYVLSTVRIMEKNRVCVKSIIVIFVLSLMAIIIRPYSMIVFVPLVIFYCGKRNLATIANISIAIVLVLGTLLISIAERFQLVGWALGRVDLAETLQFLLFPSIMSQSNYILNWDDYFGVASFLGGANLPGEYYMMAVMNILVFPLVLMGIVLSKKSEIKEIVNWLFASINVTLLYSLTYNTIYTRHKLLIYFPLVFIAIRGYRAIRQRNRILPVVYLLAIAIFVLLILLRTAI